MEGFADKIEGYLARIRTMGEYGADDEAIEALGKEAAAVPGVRSPIIRASVGGRVKRAVYGAQMQAAELRTHEPGDGYEWDPRLMRIEHTHPDRSRSYEFVEAINPGPYGLLNILHRFDGMKILDRAELLDEIGRLRGEHVRSYVGARVEMRLHDRSFHGSIHSGMKVARAAWFAELHKAAETEEVS